MGTHPRLALVIGIADYEEGLGRRLTSPVSDAQDMAQHLLLAGFEVDTCTNTGRQVLWGRALLNAG
jgi:uncharacterized caspase-like protein